MQLHAYDLFMIVVILVATLFGAWKGMAWQVASISSLIASYFLALRGAPLFTQYVPAEAPWNKFLAMLVIYLISSALIWLIFQAVSSLIERVKLQEFDQQVGALFGAFKGVVLCVAITFFAVALSEDARQMILGTHSGKYVNQSLQAVSGLLPSEYTQLIDRHMARIGQQPVDSASPGFVSPPAEMLPRTQPARPAAVQPSIGVGHRSLQGTPPGQPGHEPPSGVWR